MKQLKKLQNTKNSSFYRLYVHYLYLLGKLLPKIHYEERTKEYYKEIDKFNKLANEMDFSKSEKGEKENILIKNRVVENQLNNEEENAKNKTKDKKRMR